MHTQYLRKAVWLTICCAFYALSFSQSMYNGDMLINALGKTDQSSEFRDLKAGYGFQMANENHYLSNDGIELVLQNAALSEIKLYKQSPVYGSFKGKLPRSLHFGISSAEVKRLLGKPSVSYNSGYCEFEIQGQIISCWFENDRLSQIDIGTK